MATQSIADHVCSGPAWRHHATILLIGALAILLAACGGGGGSAQATFDPNILAPSAPSGLTATAISGTQIDLAWGASIDDVGVSTYQVERCEGTGCVNFVQIGIVPGAATVYRDSAGLVANTGYRYRVRAMDAAGNLSGYSGIASDTTLTSRAGLVAAYAFNEGGGTAVADTSGNGNTGTISGAVWTSSGQFEGALEFNGTNAQVTVANSASLGLTTAMTLEAWVYPTAKPASWRSVVTKNDDGYYLMASSDPIDLPAVGGTWAAGPSYTEAPAVLAVNAWTHLAASFDGATVRLFVNGAQVASQVQSTALVPTSGTLQIGANGYGEHFTGRIDEVRIYNRALSVSEIQTDMITSIAPSGPDTISPSAPAGLTAAAVSDTQIDLTWSAATDNVGVSAYRVERCEGAGCVNFVQIGTLPGATTVYIDGTGLLATTSYRYRVRAEDAAGNLSGYSNIASESTLATVVVSCAPGADCYCDEVKDAASPLFDPNLLFCEDFEAPSLTQNVPVGGGPPNYGPPYDDTGRPGDRGFNSYWNQQYGNGGSDFLFQSGEPSSPALGTPCGFPLCTGTKLWDPADRWSANAYDPLVAFFTDASDFNYEMSSLTAPWNTAGRGSGVFDGNTSLAFRVPAGNTHGIAGEAKFPVTRNIGLTMAMAYPINSFSSGIWGLPGAEAAWKHNEWGTDYNKSSGFDGLFVFYNQEGPRSGIPFAGFLGSFLDQNYTNCASIVPLVGNAECIGGDLGIVWNHPAGYDQATDWPLGTWGCVRGYLENAGLPNMRMRVWFQGPNMRSERLIIDFTADGTQLDNRDGYSSMKWNAYANTNQGGTYVPTTERTFRYEDNLHARNGMPVPCAQIGFK